MIPKARTVVGAICALALITAGVRGLGALPTLEELAEIQPIPASTMSELMIKVIYPVSDTVLYVASRPPQTEADWKVLERDAMLLAETANLMLMPQRALDDGQWMKDTKLMLDAGLAAYEAALARDIDALIELNDPVYQSCVVCHQHYRPAYLEDAKLKLQDPPG